MIRVLYVDDEPALLAIGKEILEMDPEFQVDTCTSGEEALNQLADKVYDIIISDYSMPGISGIELLIQVKRDHPGIPFLILTGQSDEAAVIQALNSGADYYLKKSSHTEESFLSLNRLIHVFVSRSRSEKQIRESERKFWHLFDSSVDAIIFTDISGAIRDGNSAFFFLTGYEWEELQQLTYQQITPEHWWGRDEEMQQDVLNRGYSEEYEKEFIRKDGTTFPSSVRRWLARDEEGNVSGEWSLIRNISDEKKATEALVREHKNFLTIFSSAPVGLLLVDGETTILEANTVIRRMVFRESAPVTGERLGGGLGCIHSHEDPRGCGFSPSCPDCPLRREVEQVIRKGGNVHGSVISLMLIGEGTPALRWFSISVEPVSIDGADCFIISLADITDLKNLTEQLRVSEEKYKSIFENQIDLFFQTDPSGIILTVSPSSSQVSGWSPEELTGRQIMDLFPVSHERAGLLATLIQKKILLDHEILLLTREGRAIPVSLNVHIIRDEEGNPEVVEGTIRDISRRKEAEESLVRSERKYRQLYEGLIDGYVYFDLDGRFIESNKIFEELVGYSAEELRSRSYLDITPEQWHTENKRIITQEIMVKGFAPVFEKEYQRSDGRIIPVELRAVLSRDTEGRPVGMWALVRDISERKKQEGRLKVQSQILDTIAEGVCLIRSRDLALVYTNPKFEAMFGYTHDELKAAPIRMICAIEEGELSCWREEEIRRTLQMRNEWNGTVRCLKKGGVPIWCLITYSPFRHPEHGDVWVGAFTDITDRKRSEDALSLASKKLNLMSSITRHDILNQLSALLGYIMFAQELTKDQEVKMYLLKEERIAEKITREITFTRDYQEMGIQAPVWQHIPSLITKAVSGLTMGDVRLSVAFPDIEIFADMLLEKVFYNLVENALRYGGEKMRKISISSMFSGPDLIIFCEDDGNGVLEPDKSNIFARGFGKHTGLGLFLTREILAITGISITETGKEGEGARFEIRVPRGLYRTAEGPGEAS